MSLYRKHQPYRKHQLYRGGAAPVLVRWIGPGFTFPWNVGDLIETSFALPFTAPPKKETSRGLDWQPGTLAERSWGFPFAAVPRKPRSWRLPWSLGPREERSWGVAWGNPPRKLRAILAAWAAPPRRSVELILPWDKAIRQAAAVLLDWTRRPFMPRGWSLPWIRAPKRSKLTWLPWGTAHRVAWEAPGIAPTPPPVITPPVYVPPNGGKVDLGLACPDDHWDANTLALPFSLLACYAEASHKKVYMILNSVSVVRLPERTPIEPGPLSVAQDPGDAFISFNLTLAIPTDIQYLKKDVDGPKDIEININGWIFTFTVEGYRKTRTFDGGRTWTCTGRSRTCRLADPNALAQSYTEVADRTAHQLIDNILEFTDFTADYQALDWLVTGGAFTYQNMTPMAAIATVAAASGAIVLSDPQDEVLHIVPTFPFSPWDWNSQSFDYVVADDFFSEIDYDTASKPVYDYVFVSGQNIGVADAVTRLGSAGTVKKDMVVDPLITTHTVSQERGRNILSDRGEQATVTATMPLTPPSASPGLILPKKIIQVSEEGPDVWVGQTEGFSIDVTLDDQDTLAIWQSVIISRNYTDAG